MNMKDIKYSVKEIFRGNWVKWLLALAFICCGGSAFSATYYANLRVQVANNSYIDPTTYMSSSYFSVTGGGISNFKKYNNQRDNYYFQFDHGNNGTCTLTAATGFIYNGTAYVFSKWSDNETNNVRSATFRRNNNYPTYTAIYEVKYFYSVLKAESTDGIDFTSDVSFSGSPTIALNSGVYRFTYASTAASYN